MATKQSKVVFYSRDLKRVEKTIDFEFTPAADVLAAVERAGEEKALAAINDILETDASKNARVVPADGILRSSVAKFVAAHRFSPKFSAIKDKTEQTNAILAEFATIPYMVESLIGFDAAQRAEGADDDAAEDASAPVTA